MIDVREIRHFHLFGAIGGGADGFNKGEARIGNLVAKFRCIGSVDVDAAANRDDEHRKLAEVRHVADGGLFRTEVVWINQACVEALSISRGGFF